jgi:hypothetical protein
MKSEIKTWLDGQRPWLKEAAVRILTNNTISDEDISDFSIRNPSND